MKYINYTPTLKDFNVWIVALVMLIIIPVLSGYYFRSENPFVLVTLTLIVCFFIFNLIIRRSLSFKGYFLHPYNFLTSKDCNERIIDIPKELLFEKMKEVIDQSKFKLMAVDRDHFEILAISSISFKSWGENLYLRFESVGNETVLKFCSVTLFQISSWGQNEKNYSTLLNEFEDSLTI